MFQLDPLAGRFDAGEIYPQVISMGPDYDWDAPSSITAVLRNATLPVRPDLEAFHLHPDTRPTDLVTHALTSAANLLVSPQLHDFLSGFDLQRHEVHPAGVIHHGKRLEYRWIHFTETLEERLDFSRCEFVVQRELGGEEMAQPDTVDDLNALRLRLAGQGARLQLRTLAFQSPAPVYDLFTLRLDRNRYLLSDSLAESLAASEFTGFRAVPLSARGGGADSRG